VIVFGGIGLVDNYRLQRPLVQRLARRGVATLIVRDRHRQAHLFGFGSFFPSRVAAIVALKTFLASRGYSNVATIGISLGGHAAVVYAAELGASGALTLSGATRLVVDENEPRARALFERVSAIGRIDCADLVPLIKAHPNMKIHAYYPKLAKYDRYQAERLTGLQNVTLYPQNQFTHVISTHWGEAQWSEALDSFFKDCGWTPSPLSVG